MELLRAQLLPPGLAPHIAGPLLELGALNWGGGLQVLEVLRGASGLDENEALPPIERACCDQRIAMSDILWMAQLLESTSGKNSHHLQPN